MVSSWTWNALLTIGPSFDLLSRCTLRIVKPVGGGSGRSVGAAFLGDSAGDSLRIRSLGDVGGSESAVDVFGSGPTMDTLREVGAAWLRSDGVSICSLATVN